MLRRNLLILPLLLSAFLDVRAQYDPSFSHYWAMETAYNPAATGKVDKMNLTIAYNMSMVGFKHNPRTMYVCGDMPLYALGGYHGVGVQMINDDIGAFSHKKVSVLYANKTKLFGGTLSIGVQPAMLSESLSNSKLDFEEASDPAFGSGDLTGTAFDLNAGVYYKQKNWYAGFAVQHIMGPTIKMGETNELNVPQAFYLTGGCNIRLRNPFFTLQPSVMGRKESIGYRADFSTRLTYTHEERHMYVGLGYSPTNSATVYLGGKFHGVMVGYSYEIYTSAIPVGNGSHELSISYQTDVNLFKKGRNRHQSVRLL